MTKAAALYEFFSGFGIPAYLSTSAPEGAKLPFLTYRFVTSHLFGEPVSCDVKLWYYNTTEKEPNDKAEEISARIGTDGVLLDCDDGKIYLTRGNPWCQAVDAEDNALKCRALNVDMQYWTL